MDNISPQPDRPRDYISVSWERFLNRRPKRYLDATLGLPAGIMGAVLLDPPIMPVPDVVASSVVESLHKKLDVANETIAMQHRLLIAYAFQEEWDL